MSCLEFHLSGSSCPIKYPTCQSTLHQNASVRLNILPGVAAEEGAGHEYGEEADEEEALGPQQSSGLSHLPEYGAEDADLSRSRKRRAGMKPSARAAGKTNRRRRLDEEDERAEEARAARKRKRGARSTFYFFCWCLFL